MRRSRRVGSKGQDLKALLLRELGLEQTNENQGWVPMEDAAQAGKQFAVFMPCENSDAPSDEQRQSLGAAFQNFKNSYKQNSEYLQYELIVPLYLGNVGRWALLHIESPFGKDTRITLHDPKGFWYSRPLSSAYQDHDLVKGVLSSLFGISSRLEINEERKVDQPNHSDDGVQCVEFTAAFLPLEELLSVAGPLPVQGPQLETNETAEPSKEDSRIFSQGKKITREGIQPKTSQKHHALTIALAAVRIAPTAGLMFIGLAIYKVYKKIRSWWRRRKRKKFFKQAAEANKALPNNRTAAVVAIPTPTDAALSNSTNIEDEGSDVTSESDEGCQKKAYLKTLVGSYHLDLESGEYLTLLKNYLKHEAWKTRDQPGLFSGCIPEIVLKMKTCQENPEVPLSDTHIMKMFSEIASEALENQDSYSFKQIALFKGMADWQKCTTLEELRQSVGAFEKLLDKKSEEFDKDGALPQQQQSV